VLVPTRRVSAVVSALLAALLATLVAPAGPASARSTPRADGYSFTLRAGAVENFVHFFREIAQGVGFSRVTLTHPGDAPRGSAEAVGAGVWTLVEDEPCLLGCDPPCTDPAVGNPTMARSTFPRSCDDQRAGLAVGETTPTAQARAVGPATGESEGHAVELSSFPGFRAGAAGSEVSANVSESGVYTGVAQAYLTEVATATGSARAVTSLMRVTVRPDGSVPVVTFAFSVVGAAAADARTGVNGQNFTIFGRDIPVVDFVAYFNHQVANVVGVAGILGNLGVRLLEPSVGLSDDGTRYRVTSPVLLVGAAQGALTQGLSLHSGGVRLAAGVFEGSYGRPGAAPRS
jgi:hypothetical protein